MTTLATHRSVQNAEKSVVVAVHELGDAWHMVVVKDTAGLTLVESRSGNRGPGGAIAEACAKHGTTRVVRVAPAAETIVKSVLVPPGTSEETEQALGLLAEAQLPEFLPPHRRSAGLVPDVDRPGGRTALIAGWRGKGVSDTDGVPEATYVTEAAALAFLRGPDHGVAVHADPSTGAVTVIATGPQRALARVMVEPFTTIEEFRSALELDLAETAEHVGVSAPELPPMVPGRPVLVLGRTPVSQSVRGVPSDADWLSRFGPAVGAAMVALSPEPAAAGLAQLRRSPPTPHRTPAERAHAWISRPGTAMRVAAVALAVSALSPLAFSWARMQVLSWKSEGLGDRKNEVEESIRREATYKQMAATRWPMSKLLAALSGVTPVGVTVQKITLSSEQGLTIDAQAESVDLLNQFVEKLNGTRVFASARVARQDTQGGKVSFNLAAKVENPQATAIGVDDFSTKTLAVRMHGEGASNTSTPMNRTASASAAPSPEPRRAERPTRTPTPASGSDSGSRASPSSPGQVPDPLTDAQIAAMDRAAVMKEFGNRSSAAGSATDPAVKSRLEEEVRKLRERLAATRAGGGTPK